VADVSDPPVRFLDRLEPAAVAAVLALVERATRTDGRAPLNEAALLHLDHPRSSVRHLLAGEDDDLRGYAQLDLGQSTSTAQLVVAPEHRRHGVGTRLIEELRRRSPSALQIWAVGDTAAAQALAARTGLRPVRELLIMRRRLSDEIPSPELPPGVLIRTFRPGEDDADWVEVNAAAFAAHPEQGALTVADLADRMAQPWFDPDGFFVAVAADVMVGFHWTKQHGVATPHAARLVPVAGASENLQHDDHFGEVYVLGVAPSAAGHGLGKALLLTGLRHLKQQGNTEVELYVEADQPGPVGLYRAYGFTTASRDVMYAQP
jgi:mycothiol synthase